MSKTYTSPISGSKPVEIFDYNTYVSEEHVPQQMINLMELFIHLCHQNSLQTDLLSLATLIQLTP